MPEPTPSPHGSDALALDDQHNQEAKAAFRGGISRSILPWILALSLWLTRPFLVENFLVLTQQLNWYPIHADSIGIPIIGAWILALVGLPFWIGFCHGAFKNLPREGSCLRWSRKVRRQRLQTAVLGIFLLLAVLGLWADRRLFVELLHADYSKYSYFAISSGAASVGWILLWLVLLNCSIRPQAGES